MSTRRLFLLIYAVSGAAALIDEVAWTRLLTLQNGHTIAAVSTVLAAFMGGMAAGAAVSGRYAARANRVQALRAYAALEALVGCCALLLPAALVATWPLLAAAYGGGNPGWLFGASRIVVALILLLPPTAAMGATFPLATRWLVVAINHAGSDTGRLYAANTIGAALGALLAGFVFLPRLGLRATIVLAAATSLSAAAGAVWLAASQREELNTRSGSAPTGHVRRVARRVSRGAIVQPDTAIERHIGVWPAAAVLGVSGFTSLVFEVAWTRVLAVIIGPTTYAFSTMLAAFIGGLACGSAIGSRIADRVRAPGVWLAVVLMVAAACPLAIFPVAGRLPLTIARLTAAPDASFSSIVLVQSLLVGALLLPMTCALGATLPLAVAAATSRVETVPREVAIIYAVNTSGAIVGSLAAGFLLVPILGLRRTIVAAMLVALAAAVLLLVRTSARRTSTFVLTVAATAIAFFGVRMPPWNPSLVSAGAYKYAAYVNGLDVESALEAGMLLDYEEGAVATVSVRRVTGTTSLAIDGKIDASNGGDMLTQKLLAHLPMLLHSGPRDVAVIGLGSGVTAGAALAHPVRAVDVLEIAPEVVRASRWFERENNRALADPRLHLIVGDGRSHLMFAPRAYDVIISEPSNPWIAGMAALFTRQFLETARARLRAGGVMCQWVHTYDMSEGDLRSLLATFSSVFPHGTLWLVGDGDLLFVGGVGSIGDRLRELAGRWAALPQVRRDLETVSVGDAGTLLSLFVGDERLLERYTSGASVQTDDRLQVEFSGPRSIYGRTAMDHAVRLRRLSESVGLPDWMAAARQAAGATWWRNRGRAEMGAEAFNMAYESLMRATELGADDGETLQGLARAAAATGHEAELIARLRDLISRHPEGMAARIQLSRVFASRHEVGQAIALVSDTPAAAASIDATEQLASIYADEEDGERLAAITAQMQRTNPDRDATLYYAATACYLKGDLRGAFDLAGRTVRANARHARGWTLLGVTEAIAGRAPEARQAFERALEADPRDASVYSNLGLLDQQAGDLKNAAGRFAEALLVDPAYAPARTALINLLEAAGAHDRATELRTLGMTAAEPRTLSE